jgi:hypothetical protein
MTNNFRGYGGNASETDNYDWWSPVITEPKYNTLDEYTGTYTFPDGSIFNELNITTNGNVLTMTSAMGSTNLQNQGGDNFYLNEYGAPVIFRRGSNGVVDSVYIQVQGIELFGKKYGYQYVAPIVDTVFDGGYIYNGGDMLSGLNDALNAQIAADIEKQIGEQIKAQLLADEEFRKATAILADAEIKRLATEEADAENKRLSAIEAEIIAKEKAALALDAENKRVAAIEAETIAKEKAALALAEAERQKLAAIEAQKVADAKKLTPSVIVTPQVEVKKPVQQVITPEQIQAKVIVDNLTKNTTITPTKPNNTMFIGGILLAVVVLYVVTKD